MPYQGLAQYQRQRQDPLAQRPGESDEAHRRRIAPHLRHAQAVEDEEWARHRARVDQPVGEGSGMFGRTAATERATAVQTRGFGGEQRVEQLGHFGASSVPGSVSIPRVYPAKLAQEAPPRHLVTNLQPTGEGWFVR